MIHAGAGTPLSRLGWRLRRLLSTPAPVPRGQPHVHRGWWQTELRFREEVTQSRMLTWFPDVLRVGYTRTMLGALYLQPRPRRIGIIGLGGGSQAKFCYRHLPQVSIEAVEFDPQVLALRREFDVPEDDARLQVHCDDGARWIRRRPGYFDILLVDAYDADGIPAALSTQGFYDDCRNALAEGGVLACNLYATQSRRHLTRLQRSFDGRVLHLPEPRMSNQVALAWKTPLARLDCQPMDATLPWLARRQLSEVRGRLKNCFMDGSIR